MLHDWMCGRGLCHLGACPWAWPAPWRAGKAEAAPGPRVPGPGVRRGHGRGRLGPAAPRRVHPHRAPRLRHLRHRLQGLQEGRAEPAAGLAFLLPNLLPHSRGTPIFQSFAWGTAPMGPPAPAAPLQGFLPFPPHAAGWGSSPGGLFGWRAPALPPVLGRGTPVRWWPSSASTRGA